MSIKEFIKRRTEKKYKEVKKFHAKFQVPSLQYLLYTKYKDRKWLIFIMFHLIDICFLIFWFWSLYYVASVLSYCTNQNYLMIQYFNDSNLNLNLTKEFFENLTFVIE